MMVPTGAPFPALAATEVAAAEWDTEDIVVIGCDNELPLEPDTVEMGTLTDAL